MLALISQEVVVERARGSPRERREGSKRRCREEEVKEEEAVPKTENVFGFQVMGKNT